MDLNGKVAIVTGAARGLGREYVCCLAAVGAAVIAADRRDCTQTVTEVESAGGKALKKWGQGLFSDYNLTLASVF